MLTNLIYGFTLFTAPIINNISGIMYQQNAQTCSLYVYSHYSIAVNIPACFGLLGSIIILESNQTNTV